ncbi:MAG TPA: response regulator transcription factor [Lysobacter sp.]|nr:response regulator transcription factor [Lysobacter sp.]
MHRLVVADDHPVVFHAVRAALPSPAFRIVAECTRGDDAIEAVRQHAADLLVLDLHMPGTGGIPVLRHLRAIGARVRVLVLSCDDDATGGTRALRAGADGYVAKSSAMADLTLALNMVARGQRFFRAAAIPSAAGHAPLDDDALLGSLTEREFDVLKALAAGRSNREIADDLAVHPKAISAVRAKLTRKLGTSSLAALIDFARQNNITPG